MSSHAVDVRYDQSAGVYMCVLKDTARKREKECTRSLAKDKKRPKEKKGKKKRNQAQRRRKMRARGRAKGRKRKELVSLSLDRVFGRFADGSSRGRLTNGDVELAELYKREHKEVETEGECQFGTTQNTSNPDAKLIEPALPSYQARKDKKNPSIETPDLP